MKTKRGTKLLVSGWWGMARKINYTGDWLMGLSWCLCCGGVSPVRRTRLTRLAARAPIPNLFPLPPCAFLSQVAYFYSIYFLILLIHRAIRDDHFCREKYGHDWQEYKKKVPAVFVPGII